MKVAADLPHFHFLHATSVTWQRGGLMTWHASYLPKHISVKDELSMFSVVHMHFQLDFYEEMVI